MLDRGGRWNIGYGNSVHKLKDIWIPKTRDLQSDLGPSLTNEQLDCLNNKVSYLIDQTTRWWDLQKLRALFNPKVIGEILKIRPSFSGNSDLWLWEHETSGLYTVQSGYCFFKSILKPDPGEPSSVADRKKFWNTLWKLRRSRSLLGEHLNNVPLRNII